MHLQGLLIFLVLVRKPRIRSMIWASLGPACHTAFSCCLGGRGSQNEGTVKKVPISPKTCSTLAASPSPPSLPSLAPAAQERGSRTLLDNLTPTWRKSAPLGTSFLRSFHYPLMVNSLFLSILRRGRYSLGGGGAGDPTAVHTLSLNQSDC